MFRAKVLFMEKCEMQEEAVQLRTGSKFGNLLKRFLLPLVPRAESLAGLVGHNVDHRRGRERSRALTKGARGLWHSSFFPKNCLLMENFKERLGKACS